MSRSIEIRFVRHATLVIEIADVRILVDPMLGRVGSTPPIPDTPNQRSNPTVDLPFGDNEVSDLITSVSAVLVTHIHADHWDERARDLIPKNKPILCQPEDEASISASGFADVQPIASEKQWGKLRLSRTAGQHGTGDIGTQMAPVSGFVVQTEDSPKLYIAGDTVWCDEVEEALLNHRPGLVVVNTGAAQFLEGDPITMTAEDVSNVCRVVPDALVIAVHMEAMNHCQLTREQLRENLERDGLTGKVNIPADGETVEVVA